MVGYRIFFNAKQLSHLCLRQPHCLVFDTDLQLYRALGLVKYDFACFFVILSQKILFTCDFYNLF